MSEQLTKEEVHEIVKENSKHLYKRLQGHHHVNSDSLQRIESDLEDIKIFLRLVLKNEH